MAFVNPIAREVYSLAGAARRIAGELQDYAEALDLDETLTQRLGDQHVGASTVVQILQEVANRTRKPDLDRFLRALASEFADAMLARPNTTHCEQSGTRVHHFNSANVCTYCGQRGA